VRFAATYDNGITVMGPPGWGTTAKLDRARLRAFEVYATDEATSPALFVSVPQRLALVARLRTVFTTQGASRSVLVALEREEGVAEQVWTVSDTGEVKAYPGYGPGVWAPERHSYEVSAA
jgi:hypothetical protein